MDSSLRTTSVCHDQSYKTTAQKFEVTGCLCRLPHRDTQRQRVEAGGKHHPAVLLSSTRASSMSAGRHLNLEFVTAEKTKSTLYNARCTKSNCLPADIRHVRLTSRLHFLSTLPCGPDVHRWFELPSDQKTLLACVCVLGQSAALKLRARRRRAS